MLEVDEIRDVPIFEGLQTDHLQTIATDAELVELEAGDVLFKNDNTGKDFYIILTGEIQVTATDESYEKSFTYADVMGEVSFLNGARKSVTAKATKSSRLLFMRSEDFRRIMNENTALGYIVYQNLTEQVFKRLNEFELPDITNYAWI
jgi:CRP-like cAMP-binding protein